ncbi:MAG: Rpn family recombination-promoting nuclease/putative transposase [Lachnospiraceae bacterium]|nr:Rpn family recombination-promoting nuclease/putative transposase [Lachnospiraceae bacterium]
MGQKDITEKILLDYNEIFSDIINVLLFDGENVVAPETLENATPVSQYKADDSKVHEQERDVAKFWRGNNIRIALLGIENETRPERDMVFRIIGYDGAAYRSQLLDEGGERFPVITIVLYFGDRHWTAPKKISELIDIPDKLQPYFSDYKLNVFEISWLSDEQAAMFQSDFGIVADFFINKRKDKNYRPADKRVIKHVDEVLKLLSVMTGDNRYEEILRVPGKEDIQSMCDVAERLVTVGRTEERRSIFMDLVKDGVLTPEEAEARSGIPASEFKKANKKKK